MSAEQTLLAMTQDILSGLSSDEVNSISDTTESLQVATIIKNKYYDIITRANLQEHNQLIQLTPSGDESSPVLMYAPDGLTRIDWIKYYNSNTEGSSGTTGQHDINLDILTNPDSSGQIPGFGYVTIIPLQQFLDMVHHFNPEDSNVGTFTFNDTSNAYNGGFNFYFRNDKTPQYCTVISNYYVIFDAYDNTQDSTLQANKTMCQGQVVPSFRMEDTFVPNLDPNKFPLLLNEAKALAFYELKQMPHVKAEQEIKRQWSTIQRNRYLGQKPSDFDKLPHFGKPIF